VAELYHPRWLGEVGWARDLGYRARLWFMVAVIGQWAFVYYMRLSMRPDAPGPLSRRGIGKDLITGYVAGGRCIVGNLYFARTS